MKNALEDSLQLNLLYDFYGELLSDRQKEAFELYYQNDLSLAEIAEDTGVSRQAVWDQLKRAAKSLMDYEAALGLLGRFNLQQQTVREIKRQAEKMEQEPKETAACIARIKALADSILD